MALQTMCCLCQNVNHLQLFCCNSHTLQKRLSELVEAVDGIFDPTVTSDLSLAGLCRMIWLLTKQKPQVCVSRLRCEDYGELNTRLHQRHVQIVASCQDVQAAVQAMKSEVILSDGFIAALAEAQGWQDEWMTIQEPKARGRGPRATAADSQRDADTSRRIPEMMQAAAVLQKAPPARPPAVLPAPPAGGSAVRHGGAAMPVPPPPRPAAHPKVAPRPPAGLMGPEVATPAPGL